MKDILEEGKNKKKKHKSHTNTKRIFQTGRDVEVDFDNSIGWSLLEIYVVSHATVSGM